MQPPAGSQVSRVPAQRTPPDQLAPPAVPPAPQQPPRRTRTVLTVVAGVLALLCVSGAVIGYLLYDRATTPDRSAPDVVVAGYIQAFLADRDDTRASELACKNGVDADELRLLREDLVVRERRFGTKISTSWENLNVQQESDRATVEVDLVLSAFVDGISQSDRQGWRFEVQRQDSWRVCAARPS